jgi:hypothetical protein
MDQNHMDKFNFLIGDWDLEYRIPKSTFSDSSTDMGIGKFKKILNKNYVIFEYSTQIGSEAKGIFAWDDKIKIYRYWWFENSGSFQTATCNFINDSILAMNWHDTLLVQTFTKQTTDCVVLKMQHPAEKEGYQLILEVILTRRSLYEKI